MLRATLALPLLNQGVAQPAITTASYNNSVEARRTLLNSGRTVLAGRSSHHFVPLRRANGQFAR